MGDTTYKNWKARLAGATVMTHDGDPDVGFYRKPTRTSRQDGNKITGWEPVAYFMDGNMLIGVIGDRDMTANEVTDLWTYVCAYPIPEEVYRDVEAGKPWPRDLIGEPKQTSRTAYPDDSVVKALQASIDTIIPAANRAVTKSDNAPPITDDLPLVEQHKQAIENATKEPIAKVTTEEEAAAVLGRKNRVAELRLAADKAGKAIYEPIYRAYTAEQKQWSPLVATCAAFEKKATADVLTFRESERKRLLAIQQDTERKQREIEEANQRAADRAIAAGVPELVPVVVTVLEAQNSVPVKIMPTYGTRSIKEEVKFLLDQVTSWDMLFQHYKNHAEVQALLTKLASADIKVGRPVPGTTSREGLI